VFGPSTSIALRAESEYEDKGGNRCMHMRESLTRRSRGEGFPQRRRGAGKTGTTTPRRTATLMAQGSCAHSGRGSFETDCPGVPPRAFAVFPVGERGKDLSSWQIVGGPKARRIGRAGVWPRPRRTKPS